MERTLAVQHFAVFSLRVVLYGENGMDFTLPDSLHA